MNYQDMGDTNLIKYIIASENDMDLLMDSRLEMLRSANNLPENYKFSNEFITNIKSYFTQGNQTTVLAIDDCVIGCATMCYIKIMPTFSHPTGKRAHLMNVYTSPKYRRQGIAQKMLNMLIDNAKEKGVTEISLDATEQGRPLYTKTGFISSDECMVMTL